MGGRLGDHSLTLTADAATHTHTKGPALFLSRSELQPTSAQWAWDVKKEKRIRAKGGEREQQHRTFGSHGFLFWFE